MQMQCFGEKSQYSAKAFSDKWAFFVKNSDFNINIILN